MISKFKSPRSTGWADIITVSLITDWYRQFHIPHVIQIHIIYQTKSSQPLGDSPTSSRTFKVVTGTADWQTQTVGMLLYTLQRPIFLEPERVHLWSQFPSLNLNISRVEEQDNAPRAENHCIRLSTDLQWLVIKKSLLWFWLWEEGSVRTE